MIMYRIKSIFQANILLTMYNALIMPHFSYCLFAWGSNIRAGHKLHLLQKKALRSIDGSYYRFPIINQSVKNYKLLNLLTCVQV